VEFGLRDCLDDVTKIFSFEAREKGVKLVCHVQPDVPDRLLSDANRLREIIGNLVGNAVKFTAQGEIVVRVEKIGAKENEITLQFTVSDTGIGISSDKQQAIFEAFTQADGSATRKYGGTGLGLTISSRLVTLMGGRIWVESEPGKGSAFHFTVRFLTGRVSAEMQPSPVDPPPRALSTPNHSGLRILLAEDNPVNQVLAIRLLEKRGHKVVLAENGKAAIEALEKQSFDLVLMDVQMPEVDGHQATKVIREREATTGIHIPIIAVTAHAMVGDKEECLRAGMDSYISKPLDANKLFAVIEEVTRNRQVELAKASQL
jgi:CheY-like chemotaxis protein